MKNKSTLIFIIMFIMIIILSTHYIVYLMLNNMFSIDENRIKDKDDYRSLIFACGTLQFIISTLVHFIFTFVRAFKEKINSDNFLTSLKISFLNCLPFTLHFIVNTLILTYAFKISLINNILLTLFSCLIYIGYIVFRIVCGINYVNDNQMGIDGVIYDYTESLEEYYSKKHKNINILKQYKKNSIY